jgi:hypothetical protein
MPPLRSCRRPPRSPPDLHVVLLSFQVLKMLGHQPAGPTTPQEAPALDEDDARVAELETEHRVQELRDSSSSVDVKKTILMGIRAAFEKCNSIAGSSVLLQRAYALLSQ